MKASSRELFRDALILFVIALAVRAAVIIMLPANDSVFWDQPYREYARNFAEGHGFWMPNPYGPPLDIPRAYAFRPPLFPFLWGLVYNVTGGTYLPIRLAVACLGAGTVVLTYLAGREITQRRFPALLAGIITAFYPPLVWHSIHLMTEPMFIFLSVLFMYFLFLHRRTNGWGWLILAALAAGLGILTRSVLAGFMPIVLVWLWWVGGLWKWRAFARVGVFCIVVWAVMATWWIRNYRVFGEFVPTTTDAGHGFYVANNAQSLEDPRGFWIPEDWSFLLKPGETNIGEVEASRRLMRLGWKFQAENPGTAARLMAKRFITLWRFWPHEEFISKRNVIIYALSYVPLFPFILYGLWLTHRRAKERLPDALLIDCLIIFTTVIHTVFLAMMRYRVPLMPFLIIFAAWGVVALCEKLRKPSPENG